MKNWTIYKVPTSKCQSISIRVEILYSSENKCMLEKNVLCQNPFSQIELDLARSFGYKHFSFLGRFYNLSTFKFLHYLKILNNCFC